MTQKHHVIKYESIYLDGFYTESNKAVHLNLIKEYSKDGTFEVYYEIHDFLDDGFILIVRNTLERAWITYKELEIKYGPIVQSNKDEF